MPTVHIIITCARRSRYVNPSNQCVLRRRRQMRRACGAPSAFPPAPHSFSCSPVHYFRKQPAARCVLLSSLSLLTFLLFLVFPALSLTHSLAHDFSHLYRLSLSPCTKTRDLKPRVNLKFQHTHTHTHASECSCSSQVYQLGRQAIVQQ